MLVGNSGPSTHQVVKMHYVANTIASRVPVERKFKQVNMEMPKGIK